MKKNLILVIYLLVFSLAAYLRLVGGNWDQNQHLHPDERFLTMVANAISRPVAWADYFNTDRSTLNPHNVGFGFYVYGTFPVHFVKLISLFLNRSDYLQLTLVGRSVSAFVDLLSLFFIILTARKISRRPLVPLLAGFIYSVSVLPIQLSHYFAVDSFLTLFITLCLYLLTRFISTPHTSTAFVSSLLLGLVFGLAVSCKITAVLLLPSVGLAYLVRFLNNKRSFFIVLSGLIFVLSAALTIRLAYPYLFSATDFWPTGINPRLLANWRELASFNQPNFFFPPGVIWTHTPSYIFPLQNMFLYGFGVPLFLLVFPGFLYTLSLIRKKPILIPLVTFFLIYFLYEGREYALPMRYFYPLYPVLSVSGSLLLARIFSKTNPVRLALLLLLLVIFSAWPIAFTSIYTRPHTRLTASQWIYTHIPPGSTISCEYWDDCLPLNIPDFPSSSVYPSLIYHLYDPETPEKWQQINSDLQNTDYLILSSNRLYGSIMTAPEHYPESYGFYQRLFSGRLGFTPVAQFVSRPNISLPFIRLCFIPFNIQYGQIASLIQTCDSIGLTFVDDYADETFTVYDHPKVIIFKNNRR